MLLVSASQGICRFLKNSLPKNCTQEGESGPDARGVLIGLWIYYFENLCRSFNMCEGFWLCDFVSRRVQKAYQSSDFMISVPVVAYYPENINTNNHFTDEADSKDASHLRIIHIFSSSALTLLVVTFAFQLTAYCTVSSNLSFL